MGSLKMTEKAPCAALPESSCAYLLQELKMIWDEVGQDQNERERILEELEQECQEVYRRKVNSANMSRIQLHQALAESEAEFTNLLLSLGERSFPGRPEKMAGTLKEQLNSITPALQEMQMRKEARVKQFMEVQTEIQRIASEIAGCLGNEAVTVNEEDLSLKKLEEFQSELQRLKREKTDRLCKVEEYKVLIHNFAKVMGMDHSKILANVHPRLLDGPNEQQTKNISDDILKKLNMTVQQLKEEKNNRREKLQNLVKALTNLWDTLDTTMEERQPYGQIKILAMTSVNGMLGPGSLTLETIQQVESEVQRLNQLKASKMKELFLKKIAEVDEICRKSHMDMPYQTEMDKIMNLIMSGDVVHDDLLKTMDEYIYKAKEEATSRKDIMDKVEKWMASCDEERWLEEYSRDERRYSISRGAHKHLKRAERARIIVNKIPGLVEQLMAKTQFWEQERNKIFYYDEFPLLAMLKDYMLTLNEKEEEKYRQRENKKIQTLLVKRHENTLMLRPNTSFSRPSSRGFNTSPGSTSIYSSQVSAKVQLLPDSENSPAEKDVHAKRIRNRAMQSALGNNRRCSISHEDKASVSTVKQGLSPI
ncbi:65-kDa microtubule-associated protein 8 [Dichanthelium oligosanthes]|uniref:65-kDa microtubule-associated protein 8 n=1 Tax=Dichanthelium oligosanthes TaxID=888268 RepID=A0A1E5VLJ0_9POAL|nr:65-kDa microtubule-associated protein 8 [Dichanthelium oligosanthes]